jgi:AAA+ ATPase superfamily predicted ATPase
MDIIGRQKEQSLLQAFMDSGKPEFVAVYGRRRVGKTYLIKEFFRNDFTFYATGLANAQKGEQLKNFNTALNRYGNGHFQQKKNWYDCFTQLIELLEASTRKGRKVVFIDEMPWMDTPRSGFVTALEYFWNSWASSNPDILLIVCGSSSSWILNKLLKNHGGLYNRVTQRMRLSPFTLRESREFLHYKGIELSPYAHVECYMVFGGIPFYLDKFDKSLGLPQNIDALCFDRDAPLQDEFKEIFASLFKDSDRNRTVVEAIAGKGKGLTRDEIVKATRLPDGGSLTKTLEELEQSGFIRSYLPLQAKKKGMLFQSVDFFCNFHLKFLEDKKNLVSGFWQKYSGRQGHSAWSGYAFEQVCIAHTDQILEALRIAGIIAPVASWRSRQRKPGAQIDLIIDRSDGIINLCEMKYVSTSFETTWEYADKLREKRELFLAETKTRKAAHYTLVTTYGLKPTPESDVFQSVVTMDKLF